MAREFFVVLVFGAPAGILASLLAALAVWKRSIPALIVAGLWALPATYYLSAASGLPIYISALLIFAAAVAVYKDRTGIAWLLLVPFFAGTAWLTTMTLYNLYHV
jgi:hypothetical protein